MNWTKGLAGHHMGLPIIVLALLVTAAHGRQGHRAEGLRLYAQSVHADDSTSGPSSTSSKSVEASAVYDGASGTWSIVQHSGDKEGDGLWVTGAKAKGSYDESELSATGWAIMDISAAPHASPEEHRLAGFGLGYLEAYFTCHRMEQFIGNFFPEMFKGEKPQPQLVKWVKESLDWVRSAADGADPSDHHYDYWVTVQGVLGQFDGLLAGYNKLCPEAKTLELMDLLLLNLNGDLFDIIPGLGMTGGLRSGINVRSGMPFNSVDRPAHCSAAIRLVPGAEEGSFSDLLVGHATWDTFSNAYPRIFKHVTLPVWRGAANPETHTVTFSSSPGFISSIDDFYSISGTADLFVQETSLGIYNQEVYSHLNPKTVPCFIRSVVANRLARDGQDWTTVFSFMHSGTYADQWMIVDRSKFAPGTLDGASGLLWILEEAPGKIVARDMTSTLVEKSYWASYNIAYFPEMRDYMGFTQKEAEAKEGHHEYSNEKCVRAQLFRQLVPEVSDVLGMQWLMRWNDFSSVPSVPNIVPNANPAKAIACRGDLMPAKNGGRRRAFGAIDSKVSSWRSIRTGGPAVHAIAGPTREQQPMFCWTKDFEESHVGHPHCFNMTHLAVPRSRWLDSAAGTLLLETLDLATA